MYVSRHRKRHKNAMQNVRYASGSSCTRLYDRAYIQSIHRAVAFPPRPAHSEDWRYANNQNRRHGRLDWSSTSRPAAVRRASVRRHVQSRLFNVMFFIVIQCQLQCSMFLFIFKMNGETGGSTNPPFQAYMRMP